ncbi:MAG: TatD family hydrolase [Treponema sp.]|nr:TatD family hydrolase [Treponema sp.]
MNFRDFLNDHKICDAHIHLADCYDSGVKLIMSRNYSCISCSHSRKEFDLQAEFIQRILPDSKPFIVSSFGIHPQNPDLANIDYLQELLNSDKIGAIGETGFDFFTPEFKAHAGVQEEAFIIQTEFAQKYNKPLVLHGRKCLESFFKYKKNLTKVPAVVFHSFMGTPLDAVSFLKSGINGYFSFSAQIIKGNKKAVSCVKELALERLLLETDAPYQTLKGESLTPCERIFEVYDEAFKIRGESDFERFTEQLYSNFMSLF